MNVVWMPSGGCGGCTLSMLGLEEMDLLTWSKLAGIHWLWHPSLTESSSAETQALINALLNDELELDIFCLEGSVVFGPNNTGRFHMMSGMNVPSKDIIEALARKAKYVVAVGTCAGFGGMTAAGDNLTDTQGLQYRQNESGSLLESDFVSGAGLPVINISGCPIHPAWVTETLSMIALNKLTKDDLDALSRPRFYADKLVHHGCSRNEFYEYKSSAVKPSDLGCMMENMGCVGTVAHADCNERPWNGNGSCTKGGYACIDCTSPDFGHVSSEYQSTPKIGGIPIGLPTDMPKAWFVALSSLSKSATPKRIKENAVHDQTVVPPEIKRKKL